MTEYRDNTLLRGLLLEAAAEDLDADVYKRQRSNWPWWTRPAPRAFTGRP